MYIRARIYTSAIAAALVLTQVAAAQQTTANSNSPGEVVITATRTATTVDELAVPITVITRDEIENELAGDVASLLVGKTGIEIGRSGGPGRAPARIAKA